MNTDISKTVFVVDDNAANLVAVEKILNKHCKVITLLSAAKMFEELGRLIPDLIILDVEMPEMDGFETIKCLKANKLYANIPVIFYTNIRDSNTQAKGIELGAVDFIENPCYEPLLINRIKNYLNCKELMNSQTEQSSINPKYAKSFVRKVKKNVARLEEVLEKNGSYDTADMLMYTINNVAIKDALTEIGERELSAVAAKLEKGGMDKNISLILTETPEFIAALKILIDKYTQM